MPAIDLRQARRGPRRDERRAAWLRVRPAPGRLDRRRSAACETRSARGHAIAWAISAAPAAVPAVGGLGHARRPGARARGERRSCSSSPRSSTPWPGQPRARRYDAIERRRELGVDRLQTSTASRGAAASPPRQESTMKRCHKGKGADIRKVKDRFVDKFVPRGREDARVRVRGIPAERRSARRAASDTTRPRTSSRLRTPSPAISWRGAFATARCSSTSARPWASRLPSWRTSA